MKPLHIHQIYYDAASLASVDPLFIPLDNSENARPDWREYWPIRNFMCANVLDDDAYYGFFSPKFQQKTGLGGAEVLRFIEDNDADVYVFSQFVERSALYLNVFEHGDASHPGLLDAMQQFIAQLGLPVDLHLLVGDYSNSVFSNYFVARGRFWKRWLGLAEALFGLCEGGAGPLAALLTTPAKYHEHVGQVDMKVFVMERLASFVLIFNQFSTKAYNPFHMARGGAALWHEDEMRIANSLKTAFLDSGDHRYVECYERYRTGVFDEFAKYEVIGGQLVLKPVPPPEAPAAAPKAPGQAKAWGRKAGAKRRGAQRRH